MSNLSNLPSCKKVILRSRPEKDPTPENFDIIEETARAPEEGEILVEVDTLSIDAFIRTTLSEDAFHGTAGIGDAVTALGIGKVLISKSKKYKEKPIPLKFGEFIFFTPENKINKIFK